MLVQDCFAPVLPPTVRVGTVLQKFPNSVPVYALVTTGWAAHEVSLVVWDGQRIRTGGRAVRQGDSRCSGKDVPVLMEQECRDLDILHWTIVPLAEVPSDVRMRLL